MSDKKKKLTEEQISTIISNTLAAWENVDRVEVIMKDSDLEGVLINSVKVCKANIKEIHTTLFFRDEETE